VRLNVPRQRRLALKGAAPQSLFGAKVVIGVIGQLAQNGFHGRLRGALHMLLGQAVDQPDQPPVLLVHLGNARFKVDVPGKDFKHKQRRLCTPGCASVIPCRWALF
jgi:hypothetical protein